MMARNLCFGPAQIVCSRPVAPLAPFHHSVAATSAMDHWIFACAAGTGPDDVYQVAECLFVIARSECTSN
jgi:hypothetical protein